MNFLTRLIRKVALIKNLGILGKQGTAGTTRRFIHSLAGGFNMRDKRQSKGLYLDRQCHCINARRQCTNTAQTTPRHLRREGCADSPERSAKAAAATAGFLQCVRRLHELNGAAVPEGAENISPTHLHTTHEDLVSRRTHPKQGARAAD